MQQILRSLILLGGCVWLGSAVQAQEYRFSVPTMKLEVFVQPDASARLKYTIEFENEVGAHAIDIVDVGLPHGNYNISNMSASIDGTRVGDIRKSTYINTGVEIHLGSRAIPAGSKGTFGFECTMPDMVYRDTTDKTYASLQIVPTWFDAQSQMGRTKLDAAIYMLPGVDATKVKYQNENHRYTDLILLGDSDKKFPVAVWQYDSLQLSSNNPKLAISFPQTGMKRVVTIGPIGLMLKWFRESPGAQLISGLGLAALFALGFFRFTHGTGCALFFILSGLSGLILAAVPGLHFLAWPALGGLAFLVERTLKQKKVSQQKTYLPAMATVEGGGIKRGLTAPQAAVLLELPMSKVLTLVIFGLLKKGVVEKVKDDPLEVQVNPDYVVSRKERLKAAGQEGSILHDYEHAFIERLSLHKGALKECDLNEALGGLVKTVVNRMSGFDLDETQDYYRQIIKRAWTEAEAIGEVPQRDEVLDRNFEWILLDDHWTDIFGRWSRGGYDYRPRWDRFPRRRSSGPIIVVGGGQPGGWGSGSDGTGSGGSSTTSSGGGSTSLGEVASSFAGWTENTMGSLVSAIEPVKFGLNIPSSGGILDLSGVDRFTADVFKAMAENAAKGGRGGGGGGGCACACAGCACACACAGGGR